MRIFNFLSFSCKDGGSVLAVCTSDEFECNNGNCVANTLVNNTVNDCVDNSDEGKTWLLVPDSFKVCEQKERLDDRTLYI